MLFPLSNTFRPLQNLDNLQETIPRIGSRKQVENNLNKPYNEILLSLDPKEWGPH